jgi:hypothetical protein
MVKLNDYYIVFIIVLFSITNVDSNTLIFTFFSTFYKIILNLSPLFVTFTKGSWPISALNHGKLFLVDDNV